jgi:hypothetical protein
MEFQIGEQTRGLPAFEPREGLENSHGAVQGSLYDPGEPYFLEDIEP